VGFAIKDAARAAKKQLKLAGQDAAAAKLSPEAARTIPLAKDWASQVEVEAWPKGEAPKPKKSSGKVEIAQPHQHEDTEYPRRYHRNGLLVVEYSSSFDDGTAGPIKKLINGKMAQEMVDNRTSGKTPAAPVRNDSRESTRDDEVVRIQATGFQEETAPKELDGALPAKVTRRTKPKKSMSDEEVQALKDAYLAKGRRITQCPTGKKTQGSRRPNGNT
jgi:hypothetical protein